MGTWLGRKRIPPLPKETVLSDRSNGKNYRVTKSNGTPGVSEVTGTVNLNKYWHYAAWTGPVIADDLGHSQRLYVDSGSLSFEASAKNERQAPVMVIVTRRPLDVWEVAIESGALTLNQVSL